MHWMQAAAYHSKTQSWSSKSWLSPLIKQCSCPLDSSSLQSWAILSPGCFSLSSLLSSNRYEFHPVFLHLFYGSSDQSILNHSTAPARLSQPSAEYASSMIGSWDRCIVRGVQHTPNYQLFLSLLLSTPLIFIIQWWGSFHPAFGCQLLPWYFSKIHLWSIWRGKLVSSSSDSSTFYLSNPPYNHSHYIRPIV